MIQSNVRALLLFIGLSLPATVGAQSVPRVDIGFGVDTVSAAWSEATWHEHVPDIFRAWSEYLTNQPSILSPNPRWSVAEQADWLTYDLTRGAAYHGAPATVVDIRPAPEGDEFVVKTLFARMSETQGIRPIALTRVYAAQEDGRWVFGNALLRLTASWDRTQIGPIEYVTAPGRSLNESRAVRLLAFADSVATAFEVPHLQDVAYYVASGPEELHRIMGIDWTFGGIGYGYAMPANNLILSGDPIFGEENRHEVVHLLLARSSAELGTHGLVAEGLATWYGGSAGRPFPELLSDYARFLAERPDVTLDTVLGASPPDQGWNVGGAALVQLVYEREGLEAVRALFATGRSSDDLRTGVSSILGLPWEQVLALWRERIMSAA